MRTFKRELSGQSPRLVPRAKPVNSFYTSPEWRTLIADIKAMRGNWCVQCGASGRIIGDHIKELKDGGAALDEKNIQLLCHPCHQRKTSKERAKRAARAAGKVLAKK